MATTYTTRVVKADDGYDGECACGFTTAGWTLKKHAAARIAEHTVEHESGVPMRELRDFRLEHGLEVDTTVGFADGGEG